MDGFETACKKLEADMKKTYQNTDPDCKVVVCQETCCEDTECAWITNHDLDTILALLNEAPNGVQKMSEELLGLVQTSLNLGIMNLNKEDFQMAFSLRSSVANEKTELTDTVCALIGKYQIDKDFVIKATLNLDTQKIKVFSQNKLIGEYAFTNPCTEIDEAASGRVF